MKLYETLMQRRSVRSFTDQPIPPEVLEQLLDAANNAPSGGNIQPLSVIVVQEADNRARLAEMVGSQPWVKNAPVSIVFCLDFNRVKRWAAMNETEFKGEQALFNFLISYADLMCAAQSMVILAESLGLGSVYVGSIQSTIDAAREMFALPEYVLPLMVLSIGYPRSIPRTIPKLAREVIVHYECYREDTDAQIKQGFDTKYGDFDIPPEKYLEKAFIEAVEADNQGAGGWSEWTVKEMNRLEIRNNAQFLFNLRYPADVMVKMNESLAAAFKRAGFTLFDS